MNARNLFISLVLLVGLIVLTSPATFAAKVYVSGTGGSDGFLGTEISPYRSITKAIASAADGDTVYVEAATYNLALTGDAEPVNFNVAKTLTFISTLKGIIEIATIPNGFVVNNADAVVNMGLTGLKWNIGAVLTLTAGSMNIVTGNVTLGNAALLTFTEGVLNAAPTVTTLLNVTFNGGTSIGTTAAYLPSNIGLGTLTFAATAAITVDNTSLTTGNILVTSATAVTINSNLIVGSATLTNAKDILNSGGATLTIGTAANTLTLYTTVNTAGANEAADAYSGEIVNSNGSVVVNSAITLNIKNAGVAADAGDGLAIVATRPLLSNTAATPGVLTLSGNVTFANTNVQGTTAAMNDVVHSVIVSNSGSGALSFGGSILTPAASGFTNTTAVYVKLSNTAGGTFATRSAALRGTVGTEGVSNTTVVGTMTLGQAGDIFTTDWDVNNDIAASKLVINANSTFGGAVSNSNATSLIEVNNNATTIAGLLTNAGKIKLSANTLTLSNTAADALDNTGGDIYSLVTLTTGSGWIKFTGATASMTGTGKLPNVEVASATSFTNASGNTLYGALILTGGGLTTIGGTTIVEGAVTMTSGSITLGADLTVKGTFTMPQGTFTFVTFTLNLAGDFNRTGGTIDAAAAGTGVLNFNGAANQSFTPGVQMTVGDVTVNNTGQYVADIVQNNIVTFHSSLMVRKDFTIADGQVNLGTNNIRMLQATAGLSARFTNNDLGYTATGIGGVMFEGAGTNPGTAGDGPVILGTKPFSNIWITFTAGNGANNVLCLGAVLVSGDIHFVNGGLAWSTATEVGDAFATSTLELNQDLTGATVYPSAFITTNNEHTSPYFVNGGGGSPAMTIDPRFNLIYDGTISVIIGASDFSSTFVNNLAIQTTNANTITFIAGNGTIKGSLIVDNGQTLQLTNSAARTLTADGSVTHTVNGTVTGGTVIMSGATAVLTGGSGTGNASSIADLQLTGTTLFTSTGMKVLTPLTVNSATLTANITMNTTTATVNVLTHTAGTLNLNMASAAVSATGNYSVAAGTATITMGAAGQRTIGGNLTLTGGTLALGSHIDVTGTVSQSGASVISLGDYNLTLADNYTHAATSTITAGTGAIVAAPGVTKTYTLTTAVSIPNFTVNSAAGIGLAGLGLTVSNAFVHTAGDVELNGVPLTISGNTYTFTAGTYTNSGGATGIIHLTGAALIVTAAANPTYPILDINSTAVGTVTFATSDLTTPTARTFFVGTTFSHTRGNIVLGINDLELIGTTAYTTATTAGTVTGTATGANLGEVVFSGGAHNLTLAAAYSIQNVKVSFATIKTDTKVLTVGSNFTLGANFTFTTTANLVLGDGAIITRTAGVFDVAPTFGTTVNVVYNPPGALNTGNELPIAATVLNNLSITNAGAVVTLAADAQVNGTLYLTAGTISTGTKALTIAADATIDRSAGAFAAGATNVPTVTTYKLVYSGGTAIAATGAEFAAGSTAVTSLTVSMTANGVVLGADRTVGTFSMSPTGAGAAAVYFALGTDAATHTLTVTGLTTVDNGIVSTSDATGATSTDVGSLVAQGSVTVNGGNLGNLGTDNGAGVDGGLNLSFNGAAAQSLTLPGNITISNLTIDNTGDVTLVGGDLKVSGTVTFTKGILQTGSNILYLAAPTTGAVAAGAQSQGFVDASATSHVVGNVAKLFVNNGGIIGSTEAISIFPVGTGVVYRPATLSFNPTFGVPTAPNATIVVSHVDSNPGGFQKLPITDGVSTGVDVSRYPAFYWSIYTIGSVGQSTEFDLGLTGGNFTDYDSPADVRIIRRHGAVGDITNDWLLQGVNTGYDNEVNSVNGFTAINRASVGGLRPTPGAVFTFGMKTRLVAAAFDDVIIGKVSGAYSPNPYTLPLAGKFTNGVGTLTYSAESTNPAVATAAVVSNVLNVVPLTDGSTYITIKATDANNDFVTVSFNVQVRSTGVEVVALPKEFSLNQNYPNPFNPTTNISFGVPQNSSVKIAIYDMLGREVATLVNTNYTPGYYTVPFNASKLASGMYIYRMSSQSLSGDQKMFTSTKKLMLVK